MIWIDQTMAVCLAMFRIGGLLLGMPIIGTSPVPPLIRFFLAFGVAALLLPVIPPIPPSLWSRFDVLLLVGINELFIGLFMGFAVKFVFLVVTLGLEFSGMQMGFSMANVFDPQNNSQISVLAQMGVVLCVIFFFIANLHHEVFLALVRSYQVIPMGSSMDLGLSMGRLMGFVGKSFSLALQLSMPVMVVMLILHFVVGVMSKIAPQMNIFFNLAFIINIVVGVLVASITLPQIFNVISKFFHDMTRHGLGLW